MTGAGTDQAQPTHPGAARHPSREGTFEKRFDKIPSREGTFETHFDKIPFGEGCPQGGVCCSSDYPMDRLWFPAYPPLRPMAAIASSACGLSMLDTSPAG